VPVTIVVPHGNNPGNNAAMRAFGARLVEHRADFEAARQHAATLAADGNLEMVPPLHRDLVCGVATYALELCRAVRNLDTVYAPSSMGSGICGLILIRDALGLATEIVGVVADAAPASVLSFAAGRIVTTEAVHTLADGGACRVPDPSAFALSHWGAARIVHAPEAAIAAAVRAYHMDMHQLADGACAGAGRAAAGACRPAGRAGGRAPEWQLYRPRAKSRADIGA
jgi:threonine dehydratase